MTTTYRTPEWLGNLEVRLPVEFAQAAARALWSGAAEAAER